MFKKIFIVFTVICAVLGIAILFVISTFDEEFKYTPSFTAELESCRVLKTEFIRKDSSFAFKQKLFFPAHWQVSVFNIKAQKVYLLNFNSNPHLVRDSIYKFVTLY